MNNVILKLEAVHQQWDYVTLSFAISNAAENLSGFLRSDLASQAHEFAFSAMCICCCDISTSGNAHVFADTAIRIAVENGSLAS